VPTSGVVEVLRATKDDGEVARIEVACGIADDALANLQKWAEDRMTKAGYYK